MARNPKEMQALRLYRRYLDSPPTVGDLIVRSARRSWLFVVPVAVGAWLLYRSGVPLGAYLALGFAFGTVLRDLAWFRVSVDGWPLLAEIIDRERLDALLDGGGAD